MSVSETQADNPIPFIIDIEASSLHPTDSYPVEIGWARPSGEIIGFIVDLKPVAHLVDWSEYSAEIHGITQEDCFREGISARETSWIYS